MLDHGKTNEEHHNGHQYKKHDNTLQYTPEIHEVPPLETTRLFCLAVDEDEEKDEHENASENRERIEYATESEQFGHQKSRFFRHAVRRKEPDGKLTQTKQVKRSAVDVHFYEDHPRPRVQPIVRLKEGDGFVVFRAVWSF